jgi:hypothetical protein
MILLVNAGETARGLPGMEARRSLGRQFGWLWAAHAGVLMLATPLLLLRRDPAALCEREAVASDATLTA